MEIDEKISFAIENTKIIRPPKQSLATFGSTNVYYYIVTQLMESANVVREGRVVASKPKIVTPSYLINLEGFSGPAKRYIEMMAEQNPFEPSIFYSYKNEPGNMNVISGSTEQVVEKIGREIDAHNDPLAAIIRGVEDMWDVSLIKFTFELTRHSVSTNVSELQRSGMLRMDDKGMPEDARRYIEDLFSKAERDKGYASMLVTELKRWGVFAEYQDRFFSIFKK
jgi:hypothetical protein